MEGITLSAPIEADEFNYVWEIMQDSFAEWELRSYEDTLSLMAMPAYSILPVRNERGVILAFLSVWELTDLRFVEHIAVTPPMRNHGLGAAIMRTYMSRSDKPIVLEVELPKDETSRRRIQFYERLGFALNPYAYTQPPLRAGASEMPLQLMTYPAALEEAAFRETRAALYRTVYDMPESAL